MGGRSPPRGGADASAANQVFLAGSDDEHSDIGQGGADAPDETQLQRPSKRQKVGRQCQHVRIMSVCMYAIVLSSCHGVVMCPHAHRAVIVLRNTLRSLLCCLGYNISGHCVRQIHSCNMLLLLL